MVPPSSRSPLAVLPAGLILALVGLLLVGSSACSRSGDDAAASGSTTPAVSTDPTTLTGQVGPDASPGVPTSAGAGDTGADGGGAGSGGGSGGGGQTPAPVPTDQYRVPDIRGLSVGAAERLIRERGLTSLYVRVDDWRAARDVVVFQAQVPGTELPPGAVVSYRISTGPQMAQVPPTVGQCSRTAQAALLAAGFPSVIIEVAGGGVKIHRVISQSPIAGQFIMQGTNITITASRDGAFDGCV